MHEPPLDARTCRPPLTGPGESSVDNAHGGAVSSLEVMRTGARTPSAPTARSVPQRTRTAYHEAGHAVLSAAINDKPHHVSIRAAHGTLGRSAQKMFARPTSLAQVYLAGFAAEYLLTGRRPGQYMTETGFAILAHTDPTLVSTFEGIEASDGYGAVQHLLRTGVRPVVEELRQEVDRFYEIARESVSVVWPSVKALAEALLVHEELDRDGLDEAIGDADIYLPVFTVQRAHGLIRQAASPRGAPSVSPRR
jgi:hypothetical protein